MTDTQRQVDWRSVRYELRVREATVVRTERVTPHMARITFGGDDLRSFASASGSDHIKVFFPPVGERVIRAPERQDGGLVWPADRPVSRDYTPGPYDDERGELTVDFFLHGKGRGSEWAAAATEGDGLLIAGPRGSRVLATAFDWYLFIGDETAIPMVSRHLAELPAAVKAITVIGTRDAADRQRLASAADLSQHWVAGVGDDQSALVAAVRALDLPDGDGFVRAAGEATMLRDLRRHLIGDRGMAREFLAINGHWKVGRSDFDHHEPIEE